jgi:Ulp1 family protease
MIVVPINVEGCHWSLLVADMVNELFYFVDSMKTTTNEARQYVTNFKLFFQEYLNTHKGGRKCEDNLDIWRTEVPKSIPS